MLSVSDKPSMLSVIMLSVVATQSVQFSLSGGLYHKTYYGRNLRIFCIKLECLALASLYRLDQCLRVRSERTRVKHPSGAPL
jgi:hypothetical protein